jgi:hypothetical protein
MTLTLVPITLHEANAFVARHHRHAGRVRGSRFQLAALRDKIAGVVIVGRPIARSFDDGWTAEVTRLATDQDLDHRNVCSFLYGRAWRVWQAMGGRRMVTYTLASESGASLRGAGWKLLGERQGRGVDRQAWGGADRKREHRPIYEADKLLWEVAA